MSCLDILSSSTHACCLSRACIVSQLKILTTVRISNHEYFQANYTIGPSGKLLLLSHNDDVIAMYTWVQSNLLIGPKFTRFLLLMQ